jgi:hypothetical protein
MRARMKLAPCAATVVDMAWRTGLLMRNFGIGGS